MSKRKKEKGKLEKQRLNTNEPLFFIFFMPIKNVPYRKNKFVGFGNL